MEMGYNYRRYFDGAIIYHYGYLPVICQLNGVIKSSSNCSDWWGPLFKARKIEKWVII
jgi:hypothetical protein